MPSDLTIRKARMVLPDRVVTGDLVVQDGVIVEIAPTASRVRGDVIDATGLTLLPGVIDAHVSFRDPSKNDSETLATGSRAAATGGVTAFLDAPRNDPACITVDRLEQKLARAAEDSVVHHGFFIGATADNQAELQKADRACGIKVYLADRTGELLIRDPKRLEEIFETARRTIAVHAEDNERIATRAEQYADSTDVRDHSRVRDVESAMRATKLVTELAHKYGRQAHLLHLSTADEVAFLREIDRGWITAEVCPHHLFLDADEAYARLGTLVQTNPPIRTRRHGEALWHGLLDGVIDCVASDHVPHARSKKEYTWPSSPSGLPGVEWMLPLLLDQVHKGSCTLRQVASWTSAGPARCYSIARKGRLEVGYDADLVLVDTAETRTITHASTRSRCGWTPWDGRTVTGWPVMTAILGRPVFRDGQIVEGVRGRALTWHR